MRSRRSVRRFQDEPVPGEVLDRVLETATWAPNAHNRQPWRFVVLASLAQKTRLAQAMGGQFRRTLLAEGATPQEADVQVDRSRQRIQQAPLAVVLCLDNTAVDEHSDPQRNHGEYIMAVQSVALAGGQLLLAAHAEGLGGVWMCAPLFVPEIVQQVLELPETWFAQALLLLGYPESLPAPRPRRPLEEVTRIV